MAHKPRDMRNASESDVHLTTDDEDLRRLLVRQSEQNSVHLKVEATSQILQRNYCQAFLELRAYILRSGESRPDGSIMLI